MTFDLTTADYMIRDYNYCVNWYVKTQWVTDVSKKFLPWHGSMWKAGVLHSAWNIILSTVRNKLPRLFHCPGCLHMEEQVVFKDQHSHAWEVVTFLYE
jgi:hypothetical protein